MQVSHYTSPPSILVYLKFDRYDITRFLAESNFHGHRPTVLTWSSTLMLVVYLVPLSASSFFASCRSCLPQSAHWSRTIRHAHYQYTFNTFGVCWHSPHPLYCIFLLLDRCPERHFDWNQLPDSSFGLSPLYPSLVSELNISTTNILHQNFSWLQYQQI